MSASFITPLLCLLLIFLVGCKGELLDEVEESSSNFCPHSRLADGSCPNYSDTSAEMDVKESLKEWNFDKSSDYTFNEKLLSVNSGAASVKLVHSTDTGVDFSEGSFRGTCLYNNSLSLALSTKCQIKSDSETNIGNILTNQAANIIGHWNFENNLLDSGPGLHHGQVGAQAGYSTESAVGAASINLDGFDDHVNLGNLDILDNISNFSISVWVYHLSDTDDDDIFLIGQHNVSYPFVLWRDESAVDKYAFLFTDTAGDYSGVKYSSYVPSINEWTHLVLTFSGANEARLYINGFEDESSPWAIATIDNIKSSTLDYIIGSTSASSQNFNGHIDELTLYSSVLDSNDIAKLYKEQKTLFSNSIELDSSWTPKWDAIVGYWKMDGSWKDYSGKNNHGVASGDAVLFSDAKIGPYSGSFGGTSDYLTIANESSDFSNGFTVGGWIKPLTSGAWSPIYNKGNGTNMDFQLILQSNETYFCRYFNSSVSAGTAESSTGVKNVDVWRHVLCVMDPLTQKINLYIDGKLVKTASTGGLMAPSVTQDLSIARGSFQGHLDEMAVWNTALNSYEVATIYNKQKQPFSGEYYSKVFDLGANAAWTNLNVLTALPFSKEMATASETVAHYSEINGDFSNGLIGYWPLSETTLNSVGGFDSEDKSLNDNHLSETGVPDIGAEGKIGAGVKFEGVDDYFIAADHNSLDLSSDVTLSIWMKSNGELANSSVYGGLIAKQTTGGTVSYGVRVFNSSYEFLVRQNDGSYIRSRKNFTPKLVDGVWHHIVGVANSVDGTLKVYVDGVLQNDSINNTFDGTIAQTSYNLYIGADYGGNIFEGSLDEAIIYDRPLSDDEIKTLYRRGANRLKYQVRSCPNSTCTNEAWLGPDGTSGTYFSELHNNQTIDVNGLPVGPVLTTNPQFTFSDFVTAPSSNRYFQYRAFLESDDSNNLCSGDMCSPEITSIELKPDSRYYGGEVEVVTKKGIQYQKLNSIEFIESGSCNIKYQLSNDGTSYYFWDGNNWINASSSSNSNKKSDVSNNVISFSEKFGAGNLYLKAFVKSTNFQACSLQNIKLKIVE